MRGREMVEQTQLNKRKGKRSSQDKRSRIRRRKRETNAGVKERRVTDIL